MEFGRGARLIERFSINWSFLVPTMISGMVETLRGRNNRPNLSSLRNVVSSGSPLSKPLLDETLYNSRICGSVMALAGLKPASARDVVTMNWCHGQERGARRLWFGGSHPG